MSYYKELGLNTDDKVKNITLFTSGGENLEPIATDSVDVAICFNVLDHVQYPQKVLSEAYRILKPSGTLFLNCHIVGIFFVPIRRMLKFVDPSHPHHFSMKDLRHLVGKCGFNIVKERKYRMTPAITSFKAIAGRLAMFHYSVLANKKRT